MHPLIICQAGIQIGLGHLSRSLVIGSTLQKDFKADVTILIQGEPINNNDLSLFKHRFFPIDRDLVHEVITYLDKRKIDILIFDVSPEFIPANIEKIFIHAKTQGIKVVAVDGLIEFASHIDLLFIPSVQFIKPDQFPTHTKILWGWDCLLLRTEYEPKTWNPGNRVLILTGGCDATGLGKTLLKELDQILPIESELHWVTGPFSNPPSLPESPRLSIIIHTAPSSLDDLMKDSHYALTIFGVSFYELVYLGIPTVVFSPYGNRDKSILNHIQKLGIACVAKGKGDAILQLQKLMEAEETARSLSKRSREQLPSSGTIKISKAIKDLFSY